MDGQTSLIIAASLLWPSVIQVLLEMGSDVNARDRWGQTALYYCFRGVDRNSGVVVVDKSRHCARLLVSAGADLSMLTAAHDTPLQAAIRNRNLKGVCFLLRANCDPSLPPPPPPPCDQGEQRFVSVDRMQANGTPLHICWQVRDLKTLRLFYQVGGRVAACPSPEEFCAEVHRLASQPRRLTESCRVTIRHALRSSGGRGLGLTVEEKVEGGLPVGRVPRPLKDFLLLRDEGLDVCVVS
ncbi:uncharacterized protein LOC143301832 [Babylonia areolata]|uniref:uncharacterized protein LOC143301832 n=1 Tax=Babylonia areolata TaxID=304850 RepID=UPI003FD025D9